MSLSSQTSWILLLFLTLIYNWELLRVDGIQCYVCADCDIYFNETHLETCNKKDTFCLKTVLANELVDRNCGNKDQCVRTTPPISLKTSTNGRPKEFAESNGNNNGASRKRTTRALLAQDTPKNDQEPPVEISSIHCCKGDSCNGAPSPVMMFQIDKSRDLSSSMVYGTSLLTLLIKELFLFNF